MVDELRSSGGQKPFQKIDRDHNLKDRTLKDQILNRFDEQQDLTEYQKPVWSQLMDFDNDFLGTLTPESGSDYIFRGARNLNFTVDDPEVDNTLGSIPLIERDHWGIPRFTFPSNNSWTLGNKNDTGLFVYERNSQVFGLSGDDELIAVLGSGLSFEGGEGNDKIKFERTNNSKMFGDNGNDLLEALYGQNLIIDGGLGNDIVNLNDIKDSKVNTGDGDDLVNGKNLSNVDIKTGNGQDTVEIFDSSGLTIDVGSGISPNGDLLRNGVFLTNVRDSKVTAESGRNIFEFQNSSGIDATGGKDADEYNLKNVSGINIYGGDGGDNVIIEGKIEKTTIDGGRGDDAVQLYVDPDTKNFTYNGGIGKDKLEIYGDYLDKEIVDGPDGEKIVKLTKGNGEIIEITTTGVEDFIFG